MWIDTHSHLYLDVFLPDIDDTIQRCLDKKVNHIFLPNIDHNSIEPMMALHQKNPDLFFPMMGLHPCDVNPDFEVQLDKMEQWMETNTFYGIGETGLDLYWEKKHLDLQIQSLKRHIEWAKKFQKPLILHARDSFNELLEVIEAQMDEQLFGIFHCFTGDIETAERILALKQFALGIGGVISYPKSDLKKTLQHVPLEKIVLETDSPFLPPTPHRGKRNESSYIPLIAEHLVDVYQVPLIKIAETTGETAKKIFNI
jgi:TatD DNase family protein